MAPPEALWTERTTEEEEVVKVERRALAAAEGKEREERAENVRDGEEAAGEEAVGEEAVGEEAVGEEAVEEAEEEERDPQPALPSLKRRL